MYLFHNIRNWLNGNLGVLWQSSFHITGTLHMYLIIVKYPLVQISVPKLSLLTFDQLFMPLFHYTSTY